MVDVTFSSLSSCLTLTGGLSNVFALFNLCQYMCTSILTSQHPINQLCKFLLRLSWDSAVFTSHHSSESTGVNTDFKHLYVKCTTAETYQLTIQGKMQYPFFIYLSVFLPIAHISVVDACYLADLLNVDAPCTILMNAVNALAAMIGRNRKKINCICFLLSTWGQI